MTAYGAAHLTSLTDMQTFKAAGGTHVLLQAYWSLLQTSAGASLDSTQSGILSTQIANAATAGLKVLFEISIHYPPSWAASAVESFKDQNAVLWDDTSASGRQVRNWMWTATGRGYVADFISKCSVFVAGVERVRLGGGHFGELHYPPSPSSPWQFWAFGASMQAGTGIATDQVVCPYPGYTPFSGGGDAKDSAWVNWYANGCVTWMLWLIAQHKSAGFTCDIHVLHPGYGVRSDQLHSDAAYQQSIASAEDPVRTLAAYAHDPQVWPYCTWSNDVGTGSADHQLADWQKLINEARLRNKHFRIWGENTGGENNSGMDDAFTSIVNGYVALNWVDWPALNAGGSAATLAHLSTQIAAHP